VRLSASLPGLAIALELDSETMAEINEKRGTKREPVHFVAEIELDGQRLGCGVSRDASGVGLLLLTEAEPAVGSRLMLRLYVPGEEQPRVLEASVAHCEKIPRAERGMWAYRVGVKLDQPPEDLQQIVANLTKASLAHTAR
jgi:PilZ domain-containing protein